MMLRCSTGLRSCISGTMRETSTCSLRSTASSLRGACTIALAGHWRPWWSRPLISARLSRIEDLPLMVSPGPFCRTSALGGAAVAALLLLTPALTLSARAQTAQAAHQPDRAELARSSELTNSSEANPSERDKSDSGKPEPSQTTGAGNVASVDRANT